MTNDDREHLSYIVQNGPLVPITDAEKATVLRLVANQPDKDDLAAMILGGAA